MVAVITELPLFVFTTFAGLSAGAYASAAFFPPKSRREKSERPWTLHAACLVLLAIGMLGSLMHLGHPERMLNAFSNPLAPITLEGYLSSAFGLVVLADAVINITKGRSVRPLMIVGGLLSIALVCVMGWAYFTCFGIPAWNLTYTLPFFIAGSIAAGMGMTAVIDNSLMTGKPFFFAFAILQAIFGASIIALSVHFYNLGESWGLLGIGLAIGPIASTVISAVGIAGKKPPSCIAVIAFALAFIGMAVARYGFYMAA